MANFTILLLSMCVLAYGVQGAAHGDKEEQDLVYLLQKALSFYGRGKGQGMKSPMNKPISNAGNLNQNGGPRPISNAGNLNQNGGPRPINNAGNSNQNGGPRPNVDAFEEMGLEDLDIFYNFPGSDFMARMAMDWRQAPLPQDIDVILNDFTGPEMNELNQIQSVMTPLLDLIGPDSETLAEFMARFLTRAVFNVHVNCPSSLLNKFLSARWQRTEDSLLEETSELFKLFNTLVPKFFPTFADDPTFLKSMVVEMVKHTNELILEDTQQLILGLGFLDVARFAGNAYDTFVELNDPSSADLQAIVSTLINDNGVGCRTSTEMLVLHDQAINSFLAAFKSMESGMITKVIEKYFVHYVKMVMTSNGPESYDMMETVNWDVLNDVTSGIRQYITDSVIPEMLSYLDVVSKQETGTFLGYFNFLGESEMTVLTEVLSRLGWPAVTQPPVSPTASTSRRNALRKFLRGL